MALRSLVAVPLALACLFAAGNAFAGPQEDLEKARNEYEHKNYDEAENRLRVLLDPKNGVKDQDIVAEARMYLGAALLGKSQKKEAKQVFVELLTDKPDYEPDQGLIPADVYGVFVDTRRENKERLDAVAAEKARQQQQELAKLAEERRMQALRLQRLEELASEETVTTYNSRWIAMLPFGIGQFQNGQKGLGWAFLTGEGLLLAGTFVSWIVENADRYNFNLARGQGDKTAAQGWQDRTNTVRDVNIVLNIALAGVVVLGIAQAQLTFVPQTSETRKRVLPPNLAVTPFVAPTAASREGGVLGGGMLGVQGRF